jgi:ADP-dependent NAD(P)H-hydrate dehydratase / NAD(P)H-hydrate epimerase
MRILNTEQIRQLDAHTIANEPIASIDLMERAARAFVDWFTLHVETKKNIGIICGTGNNGGDGLAIARILFDWGYSVNVWIVSGGARESEDFKANRLRLPDRIQQQEIKSEKDKFAFENRDVLIDALFGSGLSRPVAGVYANVIERVNESPVWTIAVDVPSGLMADSSSTGAIIKANCTVSFQLPKLAFLLPESYAFTGEWVVVDIGLDKKYIKETPTDYFYTKTRDVQKILRVRSKFDHKGTFGHALLIAGSYGKIGAAVLASKAALRAGLGLLSVHIPECGYAILQTSVPEAMVHPDSDSKIFSQSPDTGNYTTLGIGPGLGQDPRTVNALAKTLENFSKPIVLDADALNILAANRHLCTHIPPGSILTPHPKEFERLTGPWKDGFQRLEMQKALAVSLKAVVVLKGAHTSIATEKGLIYFNSTGNPGMATGGTGDVLTGILTGLLAQNYSPTEAAIAGVFLHGLAGDLAAERLGMESLVASDVVESLPEAFLKVRRK